MSDERIDNTPESVNETAERVRVGDVAEAKVADAASPAVSDANKNPAYLNETRPEDAPGRDPESTEAILDRWVLAGGLDNRDAKSFDVPYSADGRHALLDPESGKPANKSVEKYFSELGKLSKTKES